MGGFTWGRLSPGPACPSCKRPLRYWGGGLVVRSGKGTAPLLTWTGQTDSRWRLHSDLASTWASSTPTPVQTFGRGLEAPRTGSGERKRGSCCSPGSRSNAQALRGSPWTQPPGDSTLVPPALVPPTPGPRGAWGNSRPARKLGPELDFEVQWHPEWGEQSSGAPA